MSRSRKAPVIKSEDRNRKIAKRIANKKVRKSDIVSDGGFFRKLSSRYDIFDNIFRDWHTRDSKLKRK